MTLRGWPDFRPTAVSAEVNARWEENDLVRHDAPHRGRAAAAIAGTAPTLPTCITPISAVCSALGKSLTSRKASCSSLLTPLAEARAT
jgi:hypothetical protein